MKRCSVLSVPGSSDRMLQKALNSAADEIVIDLEDAVPAHAKDEARAIVIRFLSGIEDSARRVAVRVNGVGTRWAHHDLIAVASLPNLPHSVVVPKVESAGDLAFVERLLAGAEAGANRAPVLIQALIESAAGLTHVEEICSATTRLDSVILGYADLAASLRRTAQHRWLPAQERVLWAARAAGISAVDGPYLGIAVDDGFLDAAREAVTAGFDAKWVIHPGQIDTINATFAPTDADIAWANDVIAALEAAHGAAVQTGGRMVDEAVALRARQILARRR